MQFVPAAAKKAGDLAAEKRQNFVELFGRRDARVDGDFHIRIHQASFFEKAEGKARANAERILTVNAALGEAQLDFLASRAHSRNIRKKNGPSKDFGASRLGPADHEQREGWPR